MNTRDGRCPVCGETAEAEDGLCKLCGQDVGRTDVAEDDWREDR